MTDRPATEPRTEADTAYAEVLWDIFDECRPLERDDIERLVKLHRRAVAEAAQGAAPRHRDYAGNVLPSIRFKEGACRWCDSFGSHSADCPIRLEFEKEGAAPRAEGLDEAVTLLREWSKWAHEEAPTSDQDALDFIVDSDILTDKTDAFLACRPSDERVPDECPHDKPRFACPACSDRWPTIQDHGGGPHPCSARPSDERVPEEER